MKVTINGVLYDSDAAEPVGDFVTNEQGPHACYGTLYQTPRSGRYFVYGNGGFLSRFRGEDRIIPVSESEARQITAALIQKS